MIIITVWYSVVNTVWQKFLIDIYSYDLDEDDHTMKIHLNDNIHDSDIPVGVPKYSVEYFVC